MSELVGQVYTINSVKVQFPCKAYPSQLSMMDKVGIVIIRIIIIIIITMTIILINNRFV